MKLFKTERHPALTAAFFPVPAQHAHASVVGHPSVPGMPWAPPLAGQPSMRGQESVRGTAQRIRIQGRVLSDAMSINGFNGGLDKAEAYGTRSGAGKPASGVPPRGRPV
jgi:hypothetical protein